ncbi:MAG: hypothetical protein K1X83_05300 [Oligoflexia bacterium]|nr:hypothetical protein [Oligoflexia bacterium]
MSGRMNESFPGPNSCGAVARPEAVKNFRDELFDLLCTENLSPVPYGMGATAFAKEGTPFRAEPIVVDDGSLREFIGGRDTPILKVTVRPNGAELDLPARVESLLRKHGIDPAAAQQGTFPPGGSVQFEVHRGRPTQSDINKTSELVIAALGGAKRWWEFWK